MESKIIFLELELNYERIQSQIRFLFYDFPGFKMLKLSKGNGGTMKRGEVYKSLYVIYLQNLASPEERSCLCIIVLKFQKIDKF